MSESRHDRAKRLFGPPPRIRRVAAWDGVGVAPWQQDDIRHEAEQAELELQSDELCQLMLFDDYANDERNLS